MVHRVNASHVGSCLSCADIMAVLFANVLRLDPDRPGWPARDRFILSKGHAAAGLYSVLARTGFFSPALLEQYCEDGSALTGHVSHAVPGVEFSAGSLGHGLSLGAGVGLASRIDHSPVRVVVLMSDGECDEGAVWEAALFAGHHRLGNLTAVIDYNKIQSFGRVRDVLDLEPLAEKWRAMRWQVVEVDGHDHRALLGAFANAPADGAPRIIICHTVKGKGVSFMEDRLEWHYKSPNAEQLALALFELGI